MLTAMPVVASILGDRYGIQIEMSGDSAYTDGRSIHLPSLSQSTDISIVRGYLDHEAGHIRYTDMDVMQQCKNQVETWLLNVIEDWRIEERMSERFPGCRANLEKLIKKVFRDNTKLPQDDTLPLNYVLSTVRGWSIPTFFESRIKRLKSNMQKSMPGLQEQIDPVLSEARLSCSSTQSALSYAQRIAQLLESYRQASQTASDTALDVLSIFKQDASLPLMPIDRAKKILEGCADTSDSGVSIAVEDTQYIPNSLNKSLLRRVKLTVAPLRAKLQGLLQAQGLRRLYPTRQGTRLAVNRLYRIAVSDSRVFNKLCSATEQNTAVHILLDTSSSMCPIIPEVCAVCTALADALSIIPGISVGVTSFPGPSWSTTLATVCTMLKHGQRVPKDGFYADSTGNTPTDAAIRRVMRELWPLPQKRKIILLITDGAPNSVESARSAVSEAASMGIEIYGIGIRLKQDTLERFIPSCTSVNTLEELPHAAGEMLQSVLLHSNQQH